MWHIWTIDDWVCGSIATLVGAAGTYALRNHHRALAVLPPILVNALVVPFVLRYAYGVVLPIPFLALTVGIGEIISCGILGNVLAAVLKKYSGKIFVSQRV